jgi:hypothetical protein
VLFVSADTKRLAQPTLRRRMGSAMGRHAPCSNFDMRLNLAPGDFKQFSVHPDVIDSERLPPGAQNVAGLLENVAQKLGGALPEFHAAPYEIEAAAIRNLQKAAQIGDQLDSSELRALVNLQLPGADGLAKAEERATTAQEVSAALTDLEGLLRALNRQISGDDAISAFAVYAHNLKKNLAALGSDIAPPSTRGLTEADIDGLEAVIRKLVFNEDPPSGL